MIITVSISESSSFTSSSLSFNNVCRKIFRYREMTNWFLHFLFTFGTLKNHTNHKADHNKRNNFILMQISACTGSYRQNQSLTFSKKSSIIGSCNYYMKFIFHRYSRCNFISSYCFDVMMQTEHEQGLSDCQIFESTAALITFVMEKLVQI